MNFFKTTCMVLLSSINISINAGFSSIFATISSHLSEPFKDQGPNNLERCKQDIRAKADKRFNEVEDRCLREIGISREQFEVKLDKFKSEYYLINYLLNDGESKLDSHKFILSNLNYNAFMSSLKNEQKKRYQIYKGNDHLKAAARRILIERGCKNPKFYIDSNIDGFFYNPLIFQQTLSEGAFILPKDLQAYGDNYLNGKLGKLDDNKIEFIIHHEATHWEKNDSLKALIIKNRKYYHAREHRADVHAYTYLKKLKNPWSLKCKDLIGQEPYHPSFAERYQLSNQLIARMKSAKQVDKNAICENQRKHQDSEQMIRQAMSPFCITIYV